MNPCFSATCFRPIDASLRQGGAYRQQHQRIQGWRPGPDSQPAFLAGVRTSWWYRWHRAQLTQQEKDRIDIFLNLERSKIISEHGGSGPAADRALQAMGSSVEKELRDKRRKVDQGFVFSEELFAARVVTRQMVLDAYERTPKQWQQVAQVELFTITLPITKLVARHIGGIGRKRPDHRQPDGPADQGCQNPGGGDGKEDHRKLKAGGGFCASGGDYDSRDEFRDHRWQPGPDQPGGSMQTHKLED